MANNQVGMVNSRRPRMTETVNFIKCDDEGTDFARVQYTCVALCNDSRTPHRQACAYYLSALTTLMLGLEEVSKTTLRNIGCTVKENTKKNFAEIGFELVPTCDPEHCYVLFGQLVFLLYKHISANSYERYMQKRTNAMKSFIGVADSLIPGSANEVVISLSRAIMFRRTLGSQHELRKAVFLCMSSIQSGGEPFDEMCAYICSMLRWNEMSSIRLVDESLCMTRSPILKDLAVREEVKNLYAAFLELRNQDMPHYYRILHPYERTRIIDRSRFPVLANVAQIIKTEGDSSYGHVVPLGAADMALVNRLVSEHRMYFNGKERHRVGWMVEFLRDTNRTQEEADMLEFLYQTDRIPEEIQMVEDMCEAALLLRPRH